MLFGDAGPIIHVDGGWLLTSVTTGCGLVATGMVAAARLVVTYLREYNRSKRKADDARDRTHLMERRRTRAVFRKLTKSLDGLQQEFAVLAGRVDRIDQSGRHETVAAADGRMHSIRVGMDGKGSGDHAPLPDRRTRDEDFPGPDRRTH